jgi:predicted nucleic-acid-binding protein
MIGLDTNVLVRYIIRDDPEQTRQADSLVSTLTARHPGLIGHIVLAELWWVLGHNYNKTTTERIALIAEILSTDQLKVDRAAEAQMALTLAAKGADFADAFIAATNQRAGCHATATFDAKAAKRAAMTHVTGLLAPSSIR